MSKPEQKKPLTEEQKTKYRQLASKMRNTYQTPVNKEAQELQDKGILVKTLSASAFKPKEPSDQA